MASPAIVGCGLSQIGQGPGSTGDAAAAHDAPSRETASTDATDDADAGSDAAPDVADAPSADDSPPDSGVDAPDTGCPTGSPTMIPIPASAGSFCIDSTEVTNADYAAFLAADAGLNLQPTPCSFNTDYTPTRSWPPSGGALSYPVVYVNWCDAYAYCQWAGRRLCGKIGGGDVDYGNGDESQADKDQWYAACSADGALMYPYGNMSMPASCNLSSSGTLAVGTDTMCVGGYPGIYDMNGNVQEMEDSCDGTSGSGDHCGLRGGSYRNATNGDCVSVIGETRDFVNDDIGFRCCWP